jgi:hypothetical protein
MEPTEKIGVFSKESEGASKFRSPLVVRDVKSGLPIFIPCPPLRLIDDPPAFTSPWRARVFPAMRSTLPPELPVVPVLIEPEKSMFPFKE